MPEGESRLQQTLETWSSVIQLLQISTIEAQEVFFAGYLLLA